MALDTSSAVPLYRQIMDNLRAQIDRGERLPGSRIPSEAELAEQYQVSRITVRRAVEELATAGMLTKRQGKGTYVNPPKLEHKIVQGRDTQSFADTCAKAGRTASLAVTKAMRVTPDERTGAFLGLGPGEDALCLRQVGYADGVPVMIDDERLRYDEFAFIMDLDLTELSLFDVMHARLGRRPVNRGCCLLDVVRAAPEQAKVLQVPVGEPLYRIDAHLFDGENRPLMVSQALIVTSLYAFNLV